MHDLRRFTAGLSADTIAGYAAAAFASPIAIVAIIVGCILWGRSKRDNNTLTLLLSIAAISMTQLVLLDAARTDAAVQAKLDALLKAGPAPDALVRAEERPVEQIEELRR